MKKKAIKELHVKDKEELLVLLKETEGNFFKARMDQKMNKLKNTRSLFNLRHDIARIKTILFMKGVAK